MPKRDIESIQKPESILDLWKKYPLFARLVATISGMCLAVAMLLWSSVEMSGFVANDLGELVTACRQEPRGANIGTCDTKLEEITKRDAERRSVTLLLQAAGLLLFIVGATRLVSTASEVLIRRTDRALKFVTPTMLSTPVAGDEIGRLISSLGELAARRAGADAEERWMQQVSSDLLHRKSQTLRVLHDISRKLGASRLSELTMISVLSLMEQALAASTVGIRLTGSARVALGFPIILATRTTPTILQDSNGDADGTNVVARLLPDCAGSEMRCLVVPVACGDIAIGLFAAEIAESIRIDDEQIRFVETFAELIGLAIASVSQSQEERRIALLEERTAIAGELHDSLAQSLAFMKIQVSRLQGDLGAGGSSSEVAQIVGELRDGVSSAYRQVRELISTFRVCIGPGGLGSALQHAVDDFMRRSNLLISLDNRMTGIRLNVNEEFHVLQVVREALSNTVQHARAANAVVSLSYAVDHGVMVSIEDDGNGMEKAYSEPDHYGLSIMQGRAHSLGGQLTIGSREGGGTRVLLRFVPAAFDPRSNER